MTINIRVEISGPIEDGRAPEILRVMTEKISERVADRALENVMERLNQVIRHPTPYYETQINVAKRDANTRDVNDRGIIYGPWLEGIGSRNSPVTRFPGYFTFRMMTQKTEMEAKEIAQAVVDEEARKLD